MLTLFINTWIKFLFLFAPFFVVSMFLSLTKHDSKAEKNAIANRAILASGVISAIMFFAGNVLFDLMGITINSFRVGAGALLFLTAVSLVNEGKRSHAGNIAQDADKDDVSVVPLAVPIIIGPATLGTMLIYGADLTSFSETIVGFAGLLTALLCLWGILRVSRSIEKILGKSGLQVMSKLTGLILAAMAAQIIMSGIQGYL